MPFQNTQAYDFRGEWNDSAGVYGIMNSSREMIYIGETDSFKRRMSEHQADVGHCMHRYGPQLVFADIVQSGEAARKQLESLLIQEYRPLCNQTG